MDLKLRSVRQFLNVPPEIIHKHDGMTGSERIATGAETSGGRGLSERFRENTGG